MTTLFDRRRRWVNEEFGRITRGSNMPNVKKTKLMRKLWTQAKRKIK